MITSRFLKQPLAAHASTTAIAPERVGEVSEDRSAVVGRQGWCFIYEGTNSYRNAYHETGLAPLGDEWARLIERRHRACEALGARSVQLVVPNKATVLPENFPEPLGDGITAVLQRLLEAAPSAQLVCPLERLRQPDLREVLFRRNDSHLTLAGNVLFAELLLAAAELDPGTIPCIEISRANHVGDLGSKFQPPIAEALCAPRFDVGLLDQARIVKTQETVVDGLVGIRQVFHNANAPIQKTLLVFGNSFFERIPSWGMTPLFAAIFRDVHFLWTPDYDEAYARDVGPDLVIFQTCERFLSRVPVN